MPLRESREKPGGPMLAKSLMELHCTISETKSLNLSPNFLIFIKKFTDDSFLISAFMKWMTVTGSVPSTQKKILRFCFWVLTSVQDCVLRGPCPAVDTYVAHTLQWLKIQVLCNLSGMLSVCQKWRKNHLKWVKKIFLNNNTAHDCILKAPYVRFRLQTAAVYFLKAAVFMLEWLSFGRFLRTFQGFHWK